MVKWEVMDEPERLIETFSREVENFVDEYFAGCPVAFSGQPGKVIHDALWGTQFVQSHELALIDTPLIQRLRRIKQTAFAYLIFPSTTHSRLEHSLGVLFQSDRLLKTLGQNPLYHDLVSKDEDLIRSAAILHDCGHGPFSHSSEEIYRFLPDMRALTDPGGVYEGCNPHEVMSCQIIRSEPFRKRFTEVLSLYGKAIDIEKVAEIVLGKWRDPKTQYLSDIINGPFDADKLDYLSRDGHFSGLPLKVDLDRLWHCTQIQAVPARKTTRRLTISANGITTLEQIVFSKLVLFSSLYHHHKVRACDCLLKAIFAFCIRNGRSIGGYNLKRATDFLRLTDDQLYAEADRLPKSDFLRRLIHSLRFRRLPKRALILSKATVEIPSRDFFRYSVLKKFCTDLKNNDPELRALAAQICDEAGNPCDPLDVWIDLPKLPPIDGAGETYVNVGSETQPELRQLKEIFCVDDWARGYAEHKWRGHVFCPDQEDVRRKISQAAQSVLEREFSISFNTLARSLCKL